MRGLNLILCVAAAVMIGLCCISFAAEPAPAYPHPQRTEWEKLPANYTIWQDRTSLRYKWRISGRSADSVWKFDNINEAIDDAAKYQANCDGEQKADWHEITRPVRPPENVQYKIDWLDRNGKVVHPSCVHGVRDDAPGGCAKCREMRRKLPPIPTGGPE